MLQKFIFPSAQCLERKRFPGELNKAKKYSQVPEQKEVNYLSLQQVFVTRRKEAKPVLKKTPPLEKRWLCC